MQMKKGLITLIFDFELYLGMGSEHNRSHVFWFSKF